MAEQEGFRDLGGSDGVLRYFKEKSDDIEKVVIPQMPEIDVTRDGQFLRRYDNVGMMVYSLGGRFFLTVEDAEMLLNDGILSRMRIRIELWHPRQSDRAT